MELKPYRILNFDLTGPFIFSCEHASNQLPPDVQFSKEDFHFLQTHWGWDIGAQKVVEHLAKSTQCAAIFGTVSRLWVDLNRSIDRKDLVRTHTELHELSFNKNISSESEHKRLEDWYHPFHKAYDELVEKKLRLASPILISIHSFTPVWNGKVRTMDIGVLFDQYESLGIKLAQALKNEELFVECNEPYTGRGGLMYSVEDKGIRHGCKHLELEINQALICTPERVTCLANKILSALKGFI